MTTRDITHIVPPRFETAATGFIGASEKQIHGNTWRVEWHNGQSARFLKNGAAMPADAWRGNRSVSALMMASYRLFASANT